MWTVFCSFWRLVGGRSDSETDASVGAGARFWFLFGTLSAKVVSFLERFGAGASFTRTVVGFASTVESFDTVVDGVRATAAVS